MSWIDELSEAGLQEAFNDWKEAKIEEGESIENVTFEEWLKMEREFESLSEEQGDELS